MMMRTVDNYNNKDGASDSDKLMMNMATILNTTTMAAMTTTTMTMKVMIMLTRKTKRKTQTK